MERTAEGRKPGRGGPRFEDLPPDLQIVRKAMRKRGCSDLDTTPEEREALELVKRARKYGEPGRYVLREFVIGNDILKRWTYKERLEGLTVDLMDLEMGKSVFGTMREALGEEEYAEVQREWKACAKRAAERFGRSPVGTRLSTMVKGAGQGNRGDLGSKTPAANDPAPSSSGWTQEGSVMVGDGSRMEEGDDSFPF